VEDGGGRGSMWSVIGKGKGEYVECDREGEGEGEGEGEEGWSGVGWG